MFTNISIHNTLTYRRYFFSLKKERAFASIRSKVIATTGCLNIEKNKIKIQSFFVIFSFLFFSFLFNACSSLHLTYILLYFFFCLMRSGGRCWSSGSKEHHRNYQYLRELLDSEWSFSLVRCRNLSFELWNFWFRLKFNGFSFNFI